MNPIRSATPPLLAAVLFGLSTPVAKLLLGEISPLMLAGVLYLGSGLGLGLWLCGRRAWAGKNVVRETPLRRQQLPWLLLVVVTGGMLGPVLLMAGLARTAASTSSLLLNLEGVLTALLAWFVFREHFHTRVVAGMAAILAGGILLSWSGQFQGGAGWGSVAIAGACLCWAIDNNLTRKLSTSDPVQIAAIKGSVAGAVNCAIALSLGTGLPAPRMLLWAGIVGFFGYGLSLVLFIRGLRQIGTARTVAYFSTAPFIGAAVAVALFHEPITGWLAVAAVLMALGVWLHLTERHEHLHRHEELVHEHAHVHDEHHRHAHSPTDPSGEPHVHVHRHEPLVHSHPHYPDIHHRHDHGRGRRVLLIVGSLALAGLGAGCASTDPRPAFSDVEKTVAARAGKNVEWIRSAAEDAEVASAVETLLTRELTADDAVQIALLNNRELQATFEEIGIAQADLVQAGLLKNPSFSVHAGFPDKPPPSYVINYSAALDFLDIAILPLRKKIAAQQLEATKLRVSDAVLKLAAEVKTAYYTLQAGEQLLERLRKIEEINEAAAQLAQKQLEAGTLNELDSSNQQAIYKQSRRDTARAVVEVRVDGERLNRLMGLWGARTGWKIAHQLPAIPQQEIALERLESLAIEQRLDVEAARRDLQLVGRALALRSGTRLFPAGIRIGVDSEREPEAGGPRTTGPTLEIEVPIFDQGQADVARLQAQLRQAERRLEALATDIRSEVREHRDLMIANRDLAEYYGQVLLPLRAKILGLTVEQYNFMLKGTYDLLLAKQQEAQTEREYIEAWRDYWIARTQLERAVGGRLGAESPATQAPTSEKPAPSAEHHHH